MSPSTGTPSRCWTEGAFTGLGYSSALASVGVFVVGSFRPQDLPMPYWMELRLLRTDTFGFACFIVAALSICVSEYLRLTRIALTRSHNAVGNSPSASLQRLVLAAARTLSAAGSTLVIYLSINSVTHPGTLLLQATHLLSWPTEGTLRVIALIATACAVGIARSLRIMTAIPHRSAT
jgi:hypothetical protein